MKAFTLVTLLAAVLGVSVLLSSVELLRNLGEEDGRMLVDDGLLTGHLGSVFWSIALRTRYPAFPPLSSLIDQRALLITVPLLVVLVCAVRLKRLHPVVLFVGCWVIACIPYVAGRIALRNNCVPEATGSGLILMILGPMYCLMTCVVLSALVLWKAYRRPSRLAVAVAGTR